MAGSSATNTSHSAQQEPYGAQLDRELTRLGIKERLRTLFNDHPQLTGMKSIEEMNTYLTEHRMH